VSFANKIDHEDRERFTIIGTHSYPESALGQISASIGTGVNGTATAYATLQMALYVPLMIRDDIHVVRFWYGAGASSGNIDMGVYNVDASGNPGTAVALYGSTAMAGTNVVTFLTAIDFRLKGPGAYYMAFWCSNTTATFYRSSLNTGDLLAACGVLQETGLASGLPSSASAAKLTTANAACVPNFGIAGKTTL
jgi:hypothetical protein